MEHLIVVLIAAAGVAWLILSLIRNPLKRCPRCKGKGTLPGGLLGRYRPCPRCGRSGEIRAWFGRKS